MTRAVPLDDVDDPALFGGKAASLGRARRAGLPVPDGFALSWRDVDPLVRGDCIGHVLPCSRVPVVVRSSAVGEDGTSASFAGQHLTVLNVTSAAAVLEAVRRVAASAHEPGAVAYRRARGAMAAPRVAVVVQQLVDAERAGVCFTRDPVSGGDEVVIEAAWGLGESVVAGRVIPDRHRVAPDGTVLARIAGDKAIAVRPHPDGGTVEVPVAPRLRTACALDDATVARIVALARRCEALFGGPQDVEWALAGDVLALLQSRPITTRPR